jgi:hypothetical protein
MALIGQVTTSNTSITNALGYTPVNKTGDTMTGTLTVPASGVASTPGSESNQVPTIDYFARYGRKQGYFSPTANGSVWCRAFFLSGRFAYRLHMNTTGGWYGPGYTSCIVHLDYSNTFAVGGTVKLNSQYVTGIRYQSPTNDGGNYYVELFFSGVSNLQGFHISAENLTNYDQGASNFSCAGSGVNGTAPINGTFGTSLSNLTFTGTTVTL